MKIILVGFGVIGRGVAKVIDEKRKSLKEKYGFEPKIVAICDSSGAAIDENGLDLKKAIEDNEYTEYIINYNGIIISTLEVIEKLRTFSFE